MQRLLLIIGICTALLVAGCGSDDSSTTGGETSGSQQAEKPKVKTRPKVKAPGGAPPQELETKDLEEGNGPEVTAGDVVTVQYVGANYKTGKEFDASWDRGEPFTFTLGSGEVIPGWDQGIDGMKVGGRRELVIPPELAYGSQGSPPTIPPNETLIFIVDLEAVG